MKWIAPAALFFVVLAACLTVLFVKAIKPVSAGALLFFSLWLLLPYGLMAVALVALWRKRSASRRWPAVAIGVSIGGLVFLMDVIVWRPEAQGAIAVLLVPLLQGCALALLLPVVSWLSRKLRA